MSTVNIHKARTHLSRLIEQATHGESVIIAKAGEPLAKLIAVEAPAQPRRLGFLMGAIAVPEDFETMEGHEIARLSDAEAG